MSPLSKGFIAALDQSGGGSKKALELYGFENIKDEDIFDLMHDMRVRIIKSPSFNKEKISGTILFEEEIFKEIDKTNTIKFINDKGIKTFVKIDKGLEETNNGVQLMKNINNLDELLSNLKKLNAFGTKTRSLIHQNNEKGIEEIIKQQFSIAKKVWSYGLVPIIEPEIDIQATNKYECEIILKKIINKYILKNKDMKVIFKFSLPSIPNFYEEYLKNDNVLAVLALSGGYNLNKACRLLSKNKGLIASFCRALLEGLKFEQTSQEFNKILDENIDKIYKASVHKQSD